MASQSSNSERRGSPLYTIASFVTLILLIAAIVAVMLTIMGYNQNTRLGRVWDALRDAPVIDVTATPSGDDFATATAYAGLVRAATAAAVPTAIVRTVYVEVTSPPAPAAPTPTAAPAPPAPPEPAPPPEGVNLALHIDRSGVALAGSVGNRAPQTAPDTAQQAQAVVESIQHPIAQQVPDVARCVAGNAFNPSWCAATPTATTPPAGSPYKNAPNRANPTPTHSDPFGVQGAPQ